MLHYYLSILRRRAWLVVTEAVLFAPVAFLVLTAGPATYSSEAVIQVGMGDVSTGLLDNGGGYVEPERQVATELEVLGGRAVAQDAVRRLQALGWTESPSDITERVEANPRGGASAIEVVGTDSTPERARQLTAAFVDSYVDYRRDLRRDELEQVQADLRERLAQAQVSGDSQLRYDVLAEWLESVTLQLSVDRSGVQVVSPPSTPEEASGGTPPVVAGIASVLGALLLGCGIALVVDLVRDAVRSRAEVEALVPAPTLVETPRLRGDASGWSSALTDPVDPIASAARGLRLRLASTGGATPTRILIAGTAHDGPDVLTVAGALAAAYGRSGTRTLLIVDPDRSAGFAQLVRQGPETELDSRNVPPVRETALPGVWWAAATSTTGRAVGLLDAYEPAEALDALSRSFGMIVLVVPSGADEAEAVALGHLVDAIVVVCALGRTPAKRLQRLVGALERSGAMVSGVALTTRAERRSARRHRQQADERPTVTAGAA